jgi:KUP system potassium uptake protein
MDTMDTSFFLGRETLFAALGSELPVWREKLFIAMFRNAGSAANFFRLPANRVVELGTQVVLSLTTHALNLKFSRAAPCR